MNGTRKIIFKFPKSLEKKCPPFLGFPGPSGRPQLYDHFMANVIAANVSGHVIPIQVPVFEGLKYVARQIRTFGLSPPSVIYLDTARVPFHRARDAGSMGAAAARRHPDGR